MNHTFQKPYNCRNLRRYLLLVLHLFLTYPAFSQERIYNVDVRVEESNEGIKIFADNGELLPMTLKMDFKTEGLTPSDGNSELVVLDSKSSNALVASFTAIPAEGYGYSYSYQIIKGDINSKHNDDYAYCLPYEKGERILMAQGYFGKFSHSGLKALDFNLPEGTNVLAAREGLVIGVKEDSQISCLNPSCLKQANYVDILHEDGTIGQYVHLSYNGALVSLGDKIKRGQLIGISGKTGFASGPHLHFQVTLPSLENGTAIATKFKLAENWIDIPKEKEFYTAFEY